MLFRKSPAPLSRLMATVVGALISAMLVADSTVKWVFVVGAAAALLVFDPGRRAGSDGTSVRHAGAANDAHRAPASTRPTVPGLE